MYSNTMQVTYREAQGTGFGQYKDTASVLSEIRYNNLNGEQWATWVTFVGTSFPSQPEYTPIFGSQGELERIEVWQSGDRLRYYALDCDTTDRNGADTRWLNSIQQFSGNGSQALPATTFDYEFMDNKGKCCPTNPGDTSWDNESFPYPRLVQVNNSYGSRADFDYVRDGRSGYIEPYNYRVSNRRIYDGIDTSPVRVITYTYGTPCYNQSESGYMPEGAMTCTGRSEVPGIGPLVGHDWVTETLYSDDVPLVETSHRFYIDTNHSWRLGREHQTQVYSGQGERLRQTDITWGSTPISNTTFAHVDEVLATDYSGGETVSTRVDYTYDNYGNVKAEHNYGAEERVVNPGFEEGGEPWQFFWSPTPASIATGISFAGGSSLRLEGSNDGGAYQDIGGLVPDETYLVRAWVIATSGATAEFQLWLHDTSEGNTVTSPASTPSTSWSEVRLNYTANETGKVRIHLYYIYGSGTIFVDEVALARVQDVGDERSVHHGFYPNTAPSVWIVNKLAWENVYEGITDNVGGPAMKRQTIYYYDDATDYHTPPTYGALTQVDRRLSDQDWPTTYYDYDQWGNLRFETDPNTHTTETIYDSTYHLFPVMVTNAKGHTSHTEYYGVNESPECIAAGYHFGSVCRTYDPNGPDTATRYTYDAFGRLTKVVRPGDTESLPTVQYNYNDESPFRTVISYRETSGSGTCLPVVHVYNGLGQLIQEKKETQEGTQQSVTHFTYNALGLLEREYVPYFVDYGSFAPPEFWQHTPLPTPEPPHTTYQYDALGRVLMQSNPDNTRIEHHYGVADGMVYDDVIDPNRHRVQYRYDAFGRLGRVYEMAGDCGNYWGYDCGGQYNTWWAVYATTDYAYDVLDNLTTVTDTLGNVTTMGYDMLGRKTQMTDPDMGTWSYDYDAAGNLTSQTDARGCSISFMYDVLNRLTGKTYSGPGACGSTPGVSYTYDQEAYGKGRRTRMDDGSGYTTWAYDARGRVTGETRNIAGTDSFTTQYTYRADDQVHTMTYPDPLAGSGQAGEVITTTYNAMGLPETLTSSLGETYVTDASYTPEGRLDLLSLGSNLQVGHDYYPWNTPNGQGRLESIQSGTVGQPTLLQNLSYGYDAVGNVQSLTDNGQTTTFSYAALDRLTGASGAYSESYNYNEIGNLTLKDGLVYDYDLDHPHAVKYRKLNDVVQESFGYDDNGNMTSRTIDGIAYTLDYNTENHLQTITNTIASEVTTFTYDADGQRVMRETVTNTIVYVGSHYEARFEEQDMLEDFDGDCRITIVDIMLVAIHWDTSEGDPNYDSAYDLDSDGDIDIVDIMIVAARWRETCQQLAETVKYYTLGGRRVAMRKVPADPPGQVGTLYYLFSDHLGSSNVSYRADGQQTITQRYYPWGAIRPGPDNALPTDYTFTGQKLDESTGLMYYGARYYDAALARFISADPIVPEPGNPQALNRYSYVLNNPLRYIDPSGHDLMIVGGYDNPNWEYPTQWKAWIMAYKGWTTEEQWSKFFEGWRKADDAGRQRIMQETGVHIFNWAGFALGVDPQAASRSAKVEDMLAELSRQMAGMKDITLIGHSKGGNLVLNYVQRMTEEGYMQPKNAVLVDALLQPVVIPLVGGVSPEKGFLWHPTVAGSSAKVVNLYNPLDPVNDFWVGTVWGAENVVALSLDVHSTKTPWANRVLNDGLQVQFDHGASRWPYLPVIMK